MSMSFNGYFNGRRIILDERKLSNEYVPVKLPHRRTQIEETLSILQDVYRGQKKILRTVIYSGPSGTGKTAVARSIGKEIKEKSDQGKMPPILVSYINAHEYRTKFQVLRKLGNDSGLDIPRRGFSSEELTQYVLNFIDRRGNNLIIILDEADIIAKLGDGNDLLYVFSRLNEILPEIRMGVGLIVIFRQLEESLEYLDKAVVSSLSARVVRFDPYTSSQLEDILWSRIQADKAIKEEAVSEEIISMIADTVGYVPETKTGLGDARISLKILYYAALKAEEEGKDVILPEHVRYVMNKGVLPSYIDEEMIEKLSLHEKLILLAVTELLLAEKEKAYVNMGTVVLQYEDVCNRFGEKPLKYTRVWETVQMLKKLGFIDARIGRSTYRGKTTLISIPNASENSEVGINRIPLSVLEKILRDSISRELNARQRGEKPPQE
ncbi:MAG: AAA family ATPase [Thermofilum sp.]|nr:AAA family ATPase [Thermofilum sp.]